MLVGVNNKTSKCMLYGQLGKTLLQASIDQNLLTFWAKIGNANGEQFSKTLYHVMYKLHKTGLIKSDWILHVQNCNVDNHWITQSVPSKIFF